MRLSLALAFLVLVECQLEDPRIEEAEAIADATCECVYLQCALDASEALNDGRGLEQEDYANLSDEEIARYTGAIERTWACVQRWILE